MTVAERAKELQIALVKESWNGGAELIEKALRDQIEDCAKIVDRHLTIRREMLKTSAANNDTYAFRGHTDAIFTAEVLAEKIRALAEPETEQEVER